MRGWRLAEPTRLNRRDPPPLDYVDNIMASTPHRADGLRHGTRTLFGGDRETLGSGDFAQARGI